MIDRLISRIARELDTRQIPYMIIGGQAVLLYGTPRLTRDIDITLGIDADGFPLIEAACGKLDLRILPENPKAFVEETMVLPAEETESHMRVDFIFSFSPYEKQALKRARDVPMMGYPVKYASPEDVVVLKMIAGRAVDEQDVNNILIKKEGELDLGYIARWLSEFSKIPEHESVSERFSRIKKQAEA